MSSRGRRVSDRQTDGGVTLWNSFPMGPRKEFLSSRSLFSRDLTWGLDYECLLGYPLCGGALGGRSSPEALSRKEDMVPVAPRVLA